MGCWDESVALSQRCRSGFSKDTEVNKERVDEKFKIVSVLLSTFTSL